MKTERGTPVFLCCSSMSCILQKEAVTTLRRLPPLPLVQRPGSADECALQDTLPQNLPPTFAHQSMVPNVLSYAVIHPAFPLAVPCALAFTSMQWFQRLVVNRASSPGCTVLLCLMSHVP